VSSSVSDAKWINAEDANQREPGEPVRPVRRDRSRALPIVRAF
jgi:hypothetical protein